ncbi:MAG: hypothetical protein Q7U37_10840 [Gallionella sp.]|nr:hypothetical protein [Gallionella sp.]
MILDILPSDVMIKTFYLIFLFLAVAVLVAMLVCIPVLMMSIDTWSGNAGAFAASLLMFSVLAGLALMTIFGFLGASIVYVFQDKLPSSQLYKYYWTTLLAVPGVALVFFGAGMVVLNRI